MFKRLLLGLALLMAGLSVQAADPALPAAAPGALFTELRPPLPTENDNKIEVIEFFWYGCPHCYAIEPYVDEWLKHKPADVSFVRNGDETARQIARRVPAWHEGACSGLHIENKAAQTT